MNMTEKEWLGSENQLGIDIWKNKYCYENENFEHWLDRICGGDKEVIELVKAKKFCSAEGFSQTAGFKMTARKSACPIVM